MAEPSQLDVPEPAFPIGHESLATDPAFKCVGSPWARARSLSVAGITRWSLPLAVAAAYVLAVVFQENVLVEGGLGWDGAIYGGWARDFTSVLRDGVDPYYVQRILPSALAYWGLGLLGVPRDNQAIIRAFELSNIVLVALSAWSYEIAARTLRVSAQSRWLGAVGLFGSFAILKFSAFDPVLTDVWGFAFGMFQVHLSLTGRLLPLALVTVLGAFAWPTLLPMGACLLFFQRAAEPPLASRPRPPWHLHDLIAGLLVAVWICLCWPMAKHGHTLRNGTGVIDLRFVRLSVALSSAYLFVGARELLADGRLLQPRIYLRAVWSLPGALALATFAGSLALRSHLTSGTAMYGLQDTIEMTVFSAIKEPAIFALAHVLYWGPLVLLMFFGWRRVVAAFHRAGPGMTCVALLGLVLSLNGESRKLVSFAPLFYLFLLPLLDQLAISARRAWSLCLASLLLSRIWITFDGNMDGDLTKFPEQMLFMVIGPWITPEMYALQLLLVLGLAAHLWKALFRPDVGSAS